MTPVELHTVVSALLDAAKLSDSQKFEFLGRISASLTRSSVQNQQRDEKLSGHQVVAQAMAPAPVVASGRVMIGQGFDCACDMCKATVYRIKQDVLENMPKKDFVACFVPLGDAPELKMPLDTWSDSSGNIAIDCPLCKGRKSLWIKGRGDVPFNDYPESTGPEMNSK